MRRYVAFNAPLDDQTPSPCPTLRVDITRCIACRSVLASAEAMTGADRSNARNTTAGGWGVAFGLDEQLCKAPRPQRPAACIHEYLFGKTEPRRVLPLGDIQAVAHAAAYRSPAARKVSSLRS